MQSVYATSRQGLRTRLADSAARRSRMRRYRLFRDLVELPPDAQIVDVGCGSAGLAAFPIQNRITGVDRLPQPDYAAAGRRFVQADACALPFGPDEFDVGYSNSLIEHIPPDRRPAFAAEIRRVSRRYFVQTPNRWFPVEPHVLLPLFQFLPRTLRRRLWRLGVAQGEFEDIELLDHRELRGLFPDAAIVRERMGPFTKSLVAVGPTKGP